MYGHMTLSYLQAYCFLLLVKTVLRIKIYYGACRILSRKYYILYGSTEYGVRSCKYFAYITKYHKNAGV